MRASRIILPMLRACINKSISNKLVKASPTLIFLLVLKDIQKKENALVAHFLEYMRVL